MPCRQLPIPDPSCAGKDFWTADGGALFADCFPLQDAKGDALPHRMRFNAYNRAPGPKLGEIDKDRVSAPVAFAGAIGVWDNGIVAAIERMFTPDKTSPLATRRLFLGSIPGGISPVSGQAGRSEPFCRTARGMISSSPSASRLSRCSSVRPSNESLLFYRFEGLIVALPTSLLTNDTRSASRSPHRPRSGLDPENLAI